MKKMLLFLLIIIQFPNQFTQQCIAQTTNLDWQWLQLGGGPSSSEGSNMEQVVDMEVDEQGNSYVIGRVLSNTSFDNGNVFNWGHGSTDIFIANLKSASLKFADLNLISQG